MARTKRKVVKPTPQRIEARFNGASKLLALLSKASQGRVSNDQDSLLRFVFAHGL